MAMTMLQQYICRRLLGIVPVLLGISLLSFALAQLSPGDPAEIMLEGAGLGIPSTEEIASLRSYLGLDAPPYVQYGLWLWRLLHGDGGMSFHLGMPVFDALLERLPVTVALAAAALGWAVVGGIGMGLLMARMRGTIVEALVRGVTQLMLAAPSFLIAILLILVFGVWLRVLPTNGAETAAGYILPSLALALVTLAMTAQLLDSQLREALAAFVDSTQETVTGEVRLKLYKGNIISAGATSPYSLYSQEFVTFEHDDVYNQADAGGFINLFGLPLKVRALMQEGLNK